MSYSHHLSDYQWSHIYQYLLEHPDIYVRDEGQCRRFVEAVFWIVRSGAQWRLLPSEYGNWNTIYRRFADWASKGIWYKMLYYFARDPDMEYIMVDSTVLRAHACAAGAVKKTWRARNPGIRPVSGRILNQNSRALRCSWQSSGFYPDAGTGRRLQTGHSFA